MAAYKPNFKGFEQIATGPEVRGILRETAEKAKSIAEGLAQDFRITGEYADSFEISELTEVKDGKARAAVDLVNTADYAAAVEWGNEHAQTAHRVLGRTLDALGGD